MKEVRTRFAPSPTGYMHIGNLRTAIYEYLIAKKNKGKFILRIEDTDQSRYVKDAIDVIHNTLNSIGLIYDEGPDKDGDFGPYIQSERKEIYKQYAKKLVDLNGAYYCFCDKIRLESLKNKIEKNNKKFQYDGFCKTLASSEIKKYLTKNKNYVIRQIIPLGKASFIDQIYGEITVDYSELEEGILLKSNGMPTYNFANVIDDYLMKITHVIRGAEYLTSTPKYNLIYKSFGWEIPKYIHLPPILKSYSKKLSKREGDVSFEDLLKRGFLKEAIVNYIVLLGWNPKNEREFFTLEELKTIFDIKGLNKSPAIFDEAKLRWMNSKYIKNLDIEEFSKLATPYYEKSKLSSNINLKVLSKLLQTRIEVLEDIPAKISNLSILNEYSRDLYENKKMKIDFNSSLIALREVLIVLETLEKWNYEEINNLLHKIVNKLAFKNSQILCPVRIALSGMASSPGGAAELAELLGKRESLRRIHIGIDKLMPII